MFGDALTDLALMLRDPYFKARITAVSKLALLADRDKRAVVLLQESMLDPDALVRATAVVAVARAGVIDITVNPCLRNLVMVTLDDRAQRDEDQMVRTRAQATLDVLQELKFYTPGSPPSVVCPLPPVPPDGGRVPFDPDKESPSPTPPSTPRKGLAVAVALGGLTLFAVTLFVYEAHSQGRR